MSRLITFARFEEDNSDEKPVCHCEECGEELFEGEDDDIWELDGVILCSIDCLIKHVGAERKVV